MEYIINEKQVLKIIRSTEIALTAEQLDLLTYELFRQIDYTRKEAYHNAYEQGKFDQRIEEESK